MNFSKFLLKIYKFMYLKYFRYKNLIELKYIKFELLIYNSEVSFII